jgi:hypothetical protein
MIRFNKDFIAGVVVGFGGGLVVGSLAKQEGALRTLCKGAINSMILAGTKLREGFASLTENMQDLLAEVASELKESEAAVVATAAAASTVATKRIKKKRSSSSSSARLNPSAAKVL